MKIWRYLLYFSRNIRVSLYICTMKYIYIATGFLFLALGVIGIFLPVLPTTPFLLLAAALFFKGSPRIYNWLLEHKYLGPYIRSFREERAIPLRAKIISVALLWITALHCVLFLFPYWWLKGMMALVTIGVTIYILSFKTRSAR